MAESIMDGQDCLLCAPAAADAEFQRVRVWEDDLWRLSVVQHGPVPGFAHLEPKRHIPHITDLAGAEASTLGAVLAGATAAVRAATDAELAYVYVFGDHVAHLHFNIAPHRAGDALRGGPGLLDPDAPEAPETDHRAVADRIAELLANA